VCSEAFQTTLVLNRGSSQINAEDEHGYGSCKREKKDKRNACQQYADKDLFQMLLNC
jgi:hypothetical protein